MSSRVKAGLVVGIAHLFINTILAWPSTLCCCLGMFYPFVTAIVAGIAAGWFAVDWMAKKPENPVWAGITAGALAALGGVIGLAIPVGLWILVDQIPGYEDIIQIDSTASITLGMFIMTGVVVIGVMIACTLTVGLAGLTSNYRSVTKAYAHLESPDVLADPMI